VMTLVSNLNKRVKAIAGFAVQTGP
jgi:hypothetical protein